MKPIKNILFFFCTIVLLSQCSQEQQTVRVTPEAPTYPVLTNTEHNPVFKMNIEPLADRQGGTLNAVEISLEGTTRPADIQKAELFYTGEDPGFSTQQRYGQAQQPTQTTLVFSGDQPLSPGPNTFWLSLTLDPEADLLHRISARPLSVTVDGQPQTPPDTIQYPLQHIGYALRKHGQEGVDTYRIPGLATTNEGTLIAVYDVRYDNSSDLQGDIDVGMSRSTDGGDTWEPMEIIMDMNEWGGLPEAQNGVGDPAVLVDRETNTIWVAGLWMHGFPEKRAWSASQPGLKPEETGQLLLVKSEDDGRTWSEPINITGQVKKPEWQLLLQGPGKGITTSDGTLVFPAQFKGENEMPHATILYSRDHGQTWEIGTGAKSNTTEAQVAELSDGTLMLNMRDNRGSGPEGRNGTGARSVAVTDDLGQTWTEHPTSREALPEPVCNAGLISHEYQGEQLLIFVNPDHRYERRDMTLKVSRDDGMTWPDQYHTLLDSGRGRGYPSLSSIDEETIGVLYESSRADLVFQKIRMADLLEQD